MPWLVNPPSFTLQTSNCLLFVRVYTIFYKEFAAFAANDLEGDVGFLCAVVGDRNNGEIVAQFAQHMKLVCTESCCRNA